MDEKKIKFGEQQGAQAHPYNRMAAGGKDDNLQSQATSLAQRLQRGDHRAAEELIDLYYKQIYLFMRRMGHSSHTSEDLTQDCFMQVWNHMGRLRDDRALNTWIYRIAANISKHYWRRHKTDVDINDISSAVVNPNATDKIDENEQLRQLGFAVLKLPRKLREVVILHYLQRFSIVDVAEILEMREGTVKSRLNRAIKALKKVFTID